MSGSLPFGCGHVEDIDGNVLDAKCVDCYLKWYLAQKDERG